MARHLPPLNSLRAFECAARHLSFTKAADELHITQSAVSHQIKTLEAWLGFPLFERNGQRISLSHGGAAYAAELGPVFTRISHATQDLLTSGTHQILNLRGYGTFFVRWLIPRISDFQDKNRDIKIIPQYCLRLVMAMLFRRNAQPADAALAPKIAVGRLAAGGWCNTQASGKRYVF